MERPRPLSPVATGRALEISPMTPVAMSPPIMMKSPAKKARGPFDLAEYFAGLDGGGADEQSGAPSRATALGS
ncbi:hypothetical protein GCM10010277_83350 [Streptomyces longisporoflavus]|nr:hypothetical protein GCM10010277_83350 [Streptomyces longisporoflavus]